MRPHREDKRRQSNGTYGTVDGPGGYDRGGPDGSDGSSACAPVIMMIAASLDEGGEAGQRSELLQPHLERMRWNGAEVSSGQSRWLKQRGLFPGVKPKRMKG